ncbi:MAG TPA: hypothetical protein VD967_00130 [Candidatus Paceibacterota bacterium]|nr:hypothetical protein [Candidatus Paceibacterota bacterium]
MFKNFLMKQMLKSKMKDVPEEQQEKMFAAIEKNPELFAKMGQKIQEKVKGGKDQMTASIEVAREFQKELTEALK